MAWMDDGQELVEGQRGMEVWKEREAYEQQVLVRVREVQAVQEVVLVGQTFL